VLDCFDMLREQLDDSWEDDDFEAADGPIPYPEPVFGKMFLGPAK
jgi:hypothetical protein